MDSIRVKYEDGVFKPLEKLRKLREGAIGKAYVNEAEVEQSRKRPSMRSSEFSACGRTDGTLATYYQASEPFGANRDTGSAADRILVKKELLG